MTLTTRLTERASSFLGSTTSRRGFLTRIAMAGSALSAAGVTYAVKPGTAYAALCNCNNRNCDCNSFCCDGYTEFCCTIYGKNSCPPGTILAGWWKVDNSDFCSGAARYYMDCNKSPAGCSCGSGNVCRGGNTPCRCRSCGHRKDGCTVFRYGNCNNHVSCVGPIMCRVVTCAKPWRIDPGCTTVARTDNNTRNHHRACLSDGLPPKLAFIEALYRDFLGRPSDPRGQQYHADRFDRLGGQRAVVARGFAFSPEYLKTVVTDFYQLGLKRDPDPSGLSHWVGRMKNGTKPSEIAAFIFSSAEFYRLAGGTRAGFIRRLYTHILGRQATSSDLNYWGRQMANGASRKAVSFRIFQSLESRRKRVTTIYRRFLGRDTDPSGRDYWSERILREEDVALSMFISASSEYYRRASRRFG